MSVCVRVVSGGEERRVVILLQPLNGDIKVAGLGLLSGTAGGITLAKPRLLPFAFWPQPLPFGAPQNKAVPCPPPETPSRP